MRCAALVALLVSTAGIYACQSPTVDPEELMAADRRLQQETATRGTDGWVEAFAVDGKLIAAGGVIQGKDAIAAAMSVLDSSDYTLTWEPEFAEGSGNVGYTHGTYRREVIDDSGETVVETGRYVTVWRRDPDGAWKAVLDIGSASRE